MSTSHMLNVTNAYKCCDLSSLQSQELTNAFQTDLLAMTKASATSTFLDMVECVFCSVLLGGAFCQQATTVSLPPNQASSEETVRTNFVSLLDLLTLTLHGRCPLLCLGSSEDM